jgi:hypothetical protein
MDRRLLLTALAGSFAVAAIPGVALAAPIPSQAPAAGTEGVRAALSGEAAGMSPTEMQWRDRRMHRRHWRRRGPPHHWRRRRPLRRRCWINRRGVRVCRVW